MVLLAIIGGNGWREELLYPAVSPDSLRAKDERLTTLFALLDVSSEHRFGERPWNFKNRCWEL